MKSIRSIIPILVIIFAALLFIPFTGRVHLFDWDEINFAESAREMIVTGDYMTVKIGFEPFWEKPPLFIWLQVLSMKLFGINEFAARFPNAICGIITLLILYFIGKRLYSQRMGAIWACCYVTSLLPFLYFKSGIIDPWFNLFIFLGIYFFFLYIELPEKRKMHIAFAALFTGLATLTKGPVGLLIAGATVFMYAAIKRFRIKTSAFDITLFVLIFALSGGFWFLLQLLSGNYQLIIDFIQYQIKLFQTQDSGHGGFFLYHPVVLFFGVFPASVFALTSFNFRFADISVQNRFKQIMLITFWFVIILFSIVKTKIVHYSSMCYFPLTFLAAFTIEKAFEKNSGIRKWQVFLILFIASLYCLLLSLSTFFGQLKSFIIEKFGITDPFTLGIINADVDWKNPAIFFSAFSLVGFISFYFLQNRRKIKTALVVLSLSMLAFILSAIIILVPRIEKHTQHALIEFLKEKSVEHAYIVPAGMKSYAHYFYGNRMPDNVVKNKNLDEFIQDDIDRDVYIFCRNRNAEGLMKKSDKIVFLYEKNGYSFFHVKFIKNDKI